MTITKKDVLLIDQVDILLSLIDDSLSYEESVSISLGETASLCSDGSVSPILFIVDLRALAEYGYGVLEGDESIPMTEDEGELIRWFDSLSEEEQEEILSSVVFSGDPLMFPDRRELITLERQLIATL